jgi:hypothetical protein
MPDQSYRGLAAQNSTSAAFRESWGLLNLLQKAGRAGRSGEYEDAEVWDFPP